jgi:hypothetical protein
VRPALQDQLAQGSRSRADRSGFVADAVNVLRGDQDAKTASIRMRKCRRVCDGRGAYPD